MTELTPDKIEELSNLLEAVEDAVARAALRHNTRLRNKLEPYRLREPSYLPTAFFNREMWPSETVVEITADTVKIAESEVAYMRTSMPVGALCAGWEEFVDKLVDAKMVEFAAEHRRKAKQLLDRRERELEALKKELKALEKERGDA